ncbi:MAG: SPASM domain-containing protein [Candidatus Pacebacteria bacterium]|nr:SPASM domain-containing protein [Candidatus Paceibacterota bacterium]
MIKYAGKADLHTMISTNASLLTEEKSRAILNSGLGEIRFALDGLTKQSFEAFRCGGNFEQVIGNIRRFCALKQEMKKHRPVVTLQFILNRYNQDQIGDIKKFAKEIGSDKLYIKPFILSPYAYSEEERKALARKFFPTKDVYDEEIIYKKENEELTPKRTPKKCPAVKQVFTVLANGEMVMCCFDLFGDYSYGNLIENDFKSLWFSDKGKKIRRLAYKRSFPLCQKCGNIE